MNNYRHENKTSLRVVSAQLLAAMISSFATLSFGINMTFTTVLIPGVSGRDPNEIFHLNEEDISWISSITEGGVMIGCLLSGITAQLVGKKRTMHFATVPLIVSWLILSFSNSPWHIYFSLVLSGLTQGVQQAAIVLYTPEIAQPHLRGRLVTTVAVVGNLGPLMQYTIGVFLNWRNIALINCIVPLTNFFLLFFIPESPQWLIMKNRHLEARKSLAWLRGWSTVEDIESEFQELTRYTKYGANGVNNNAYEGSTLSVHNEPQISETTKKSMIQVTISHLRNFKKKEFLWPFSLVSFACFLIHFSGTSVLHTYAVEIFKTLKVPIDKSNATVFMGLAGILGTMICVILIRCVGKRVLSLTSIIGCRICIITLATYSYIGNIKYLSIQNSTVPSNETPSNNDLDVYTWIPLVCVIISTFMSSIGLIPLPWILIGEVYSKETNSVGSGLTIAIHYMFAFVSNKIFLQMVSDLTLPGTFWFYGCISFFGVFVLYFALPETEGKTLQEITNHFSGVSKLNNQVK